MSKIASASLKNHGVEIVNTSVFAFHVCLGMECCKLEFVGIEGVSAVSFSNPDGREARIVRHGSRLFFCPQLDKFDECSFAPLCTTRLNCTDFQPSLRPLCQMGCERQRFDSTSPSGQKDFVCPNRKQGQAL